MLKTPKRCPSFIATRNKWNKQNIMWNYSMSLKNKSMGIYNNDVFRSFFFLLKTWAHKYKRSVRFYIISTYYWRIILLCLCSFKSYATFDSDGFCGHLCFDLPVSFTFYYPQTSFWGSTSFSIVDSLQGAVIQDPPPHWAKEEDL